MAIAVRADHLGKCFKFYDTRWQRLRGTFFPSSNHAKELWAIRHLDLELPRGCTLGVIGANGSGKTTLLQLIAGLIKPTEGTVQTEGNLATLLELGGGFQLELTGRENIFIIAGLRGFSKREIERKAPEIIAFAELQDFIERPIKHYSAGMLMRLAFATAVMVEPDVLLIDEVFSVGDMAFQHKCARKFRELQKRGTTIVLVTHDMNAVKSLCHVALLLDRGSPVMLASPEDVTNHYLKLVAEKIAAAEAVIPTEAATPKPAQLHRHGTGEGRIVSVEILNSRLEPIHFASFREEITFRFVVEYMADVPESGLGFFIRDRYGNDIIGINTFEEQKQIRACKKGDRLQIDFQLPLSLRPGSYSVSPGFAYDRKEARYLDWIDNAAVFQMRPPEGGAEIHGFVYVPNRVSIISL